MLKKSHYMYNKLFNHSCNFLCRKDITPAVDSITAINTGYALHHNVDSSLLVAVRITTSS